MTKEQQFNQEDKAIVRAMDRKEENKNDTILNLQLQNSILLNALKEIAVVYPEDNNTDSAEILCKYLIAKAREAIDKIEPETIHPLIKNIIDSNFPPLKRDL